MDFFELLRKRRSIRHFEDKEVPLDLIKEVINDSIKAPNASNMQQWSFIIINDRELMKRLSDANKKSMVASIDEDPNSPYKGYASVFRKKEHHVFYNAPCVIYVVGPAKAAYVREDCALFAAYFMLSATARGLGTCWVAQGEEIKDAETRKEIGLTDDYKIVAPIVIGYPKSIPPMPKRMEPKILKIVS